jgi:hypothetical protein
MMPRYANGCGSGHISTQSDIVGWGQNTSPEAKAPDYHHGPYDPSKVTRKHPAPRGETPKRVHDFPAKYSKSGSSHPHGHSVTEAWGHSVRPHYGKIDRAIPRGVPMRDDHAQGHSFGSSNVPQQRVRAYEDQGRMKMRGKTG